MLERRKKLGFGHVIAASFVLGVGGVFGYDRLADAGKVPWVDKHEVEENHNLKPNIEVPVIKETKWGFEDYKYRGTDFRREIKILLEDNPSEGKLLLEKYKNLVKVNEGKEYLNGGEELSPKKGDVFTISDPSLSNPGVILRQEQTLEFNPLTDRKAVYDQAIVAINGDGIDVVGYDHESKKEIGGRVIPVTVLLDSPSFNNRDEALEYETGFIPIEYLGDKLPTAESR